MSRKVLVPIPRRCLDHLGLAPGEQPRALIWGRHVVLVRPRPAIEEFEGLFRGAVSPFERPEDGPA
jgi:hypothetical protein